MSSGPLVIYVLEDNEWYNKMLTHQLSLNPSYKVKSFLLAEDLFEALKEQEADIVTLDYRLPNTDGSEVLRSIRADYPETEVIVVSEQEEVETAVNLLRLGAYDYIVKSKDIRERLFALFERIHKNRGLQNEVKRLKREVREKYDFQKTIIGKSEAIKRVFSLISKGLTTNINVTISGETGTGKEVVAKTIHYHSNLSNGPFIAVNTSAIPEDLVESELFGYEKGAFTGATTNRVGKFEEANGGTLFLDEIGELPNHLQAKLLRVLQEREVTPLGSNKVIKTNCRIIVATHRDLDKMVKEKTFREDLYYRLIGLPIHLPPLRERDHDVIILANHFIEAFCRENELALKALDNTAKEKLLNYSWPGNVRELKSSIQLAVVLSESEVIVADDIQLRNGEILSDILSEDLTLREYNRKIVRIYQKKYRDNKIVAKKLDIGVTTIYRMLKED